jgi:hypothetical protein
VDGNDHPAVDVDPDILRPTVREQGVIENEPAHADTFTGEGPGMQPPKSHADAGPSEPIE